VRSEENVRREPNGDVVARLNPGTRLPVLGREGQWINVEVQGWVWARSMQVSDREGFDLVVVEPQGENLRATPSGEIMGRLGRGTLLEEGERRPGWIRVRRSAWIWASSVVETSTVPAATVDAPPPRRTATAFVTTGERGAAILTAQDGDTLARTSPRSELAILAREGNWARVRIEGWTWLPASDTVTTSADLASEDISLADITDEPDRYRGRVVTWELQFISLERAEQVRTDLFEGEPYLLTRYGGPSGPFVYVAVPPDRVGEVGGIIPLEWLSVAGRIRTGASALTGAPIVELITLERLRSPR